MEDNTCRIQDKDQLLGGDSIQIQTSNAYGQANHDSFININRTREHTMNLNDLLSVVRIFDEA